MNAKLPEFSLFPSGLARGLDARLQVVLAWAWYHAMRGQSPGVAELAREAGMAEATVMKCLATLADHGLVVTDGAGKDRVIACRIPPDDGSGGGVYVSYDAKPVEPKPSRAEAKKRDPERRNLIARIVSDYCSRTGGVIEHGFVGKHIVPLLDVYTPEQVMAGWESYASGTEPRFLSVAAFARRAGVYIRGNEEELPASNDDQFDLMLG